MAIYVDDFKLAGPSGNLSRGWELLKKRLDIGEANNLGMRLGCEKKEKTFMIDGQVKQNTWSRVRHGGVFGTTREAAPGRGKRSGHEDGTRTVPRFSKSEVKNKGSRKGT